MEPGRFAARPGAYVSGRSPFSAGPGLVEGPPLLLGPDRCVDIPCLIAQRTHGRTRSVYVSREALADVEVHHNLLVRHGGKEGGSSSRGCGNSEAPACGAAHGHGPASLGGHPTDLVGQSGGIPDRWDGQRDSLFRSCIRTGETGDQWMRRGVTGVPTPACPHRAHRSATEPRRSFGSSWPRPLGGWPPMPPGRPRRSATGLRGVDATGTAS